MGLRSQNNPQASFRDVFSGTGSDAAGAAPPGASSGHVATGGVISEYTSGSDVYRAHVFTSSGTFNVTTAGNIETGVEFLVVGGGAGGGGSRENYAGQGGGGAGGLITNVPGVSTPVGSPNPSVNLSRALDFPVTDGGTYPVVVGAGGVGGYYPGGGFPNGTGDAGSSSVLTHPSSPYTVTATGGGGGGAAANSPGNEAQQGGSGGGGSGYPNSVQAGAAANPNTNPNRQGHPGGNGAPGGPQSSGGGGGGAGGAGETGLGPGHPRAARGGLGLEVNITGITTAYAGGGGSGSYFNPHNTVREPNAPENGGGGGSGGLGGGTDLYRTIGQNGAPGTGGGGGGATAHHPPGGPRQGGTGGGGTVIIRYKIAQLDSGTAKATGGNVSFYNGKTIHTFLRSGTFTTPASFNETCEVVVVGGGGGGAGGQQPSRYAGGGGGAGGVAIHPGTPVSGANTITVTVGTGGAGSPGNQGGGANHGSNGSPSYWGPGPVPAGITALGGGWGGGDQGPRGVDGGGGASQGPGPVGSGGGGGELFNGNPDAGYGGNAGQPNQAQLAGTLNYGNPGGSGSASPDVNYRRGGGGGGAGGAGAQASSNNDNTTAHGGIGIQLPATFHNPDSIPVSNGLDSGGLGAPGPTATNVSGGVSGKFWIAGGGGGGSSHPSARAGKGGGNDPGGGGHSGPGNYAGAGIGHRAPNMTNAASRGWANTGGGGGGAGGNPGTPVGDGGDGGSGIVLIAYPT